MRTNPQAKRAHPGSAQRYAYIIEEIWAQRASVLLEVGTWNGNRACEMIRAAYQATAQAVYYGFDLFEEMTPAKAQAEFNVKQPFSYTTVSTKLKAFVLERSGSRYTLYRGDTKETLPAFTNGTEAREAIDLAWVDGGHSTETIAGDYKNVRKAMRPNGIILLDDYYTGMPEPGFTEKFGCNMLVKALETEGAPVEILPQRDLVKGGGFAQVVRVQV